MSSPSPPPPPPVQESSNSPQVTEILSSVTNFSKNNLKKTTTRVRTKDGHLYEVHTYHSKTEREQEKLTENGFSVESVGKDLLPQYLQDNQKGYASLPGGFFDSNSSSWKNLRSDITSKLPEQSLESIKHLSVVSYNVWFAEQDQEERAEGLLTLISKLSPKPDVICLQEVTQPFLDIVKKTKWIRDEYYLSDIQGTTVYPYGVLIISRIPFDSVTIHHLPSNQGRRFLKAVLRLSSHGNSNNAEKDKVVIGTVHLESLDNTAMRIEQLGLIFSTINSHTHALFMGDFNFGPGKQYALFQLITDHCRENKHLDSSFTDVWPAIHPQQYGATMPDGSRIDHVMLKSSLLKPKSIELLGTTPLRNEIYPSDHYGLHAVVSL